MYKFRHAPAVVAVRQAAKTGAGVVEHVPGGAGSRDNASDMFICKYPFQGKLRPAFTIEFL